MHWPRWSEAMRLQPIGFRKCEVGQSVRSLCRIRIKTDNSHRSAPDGQSALEVLDTLTKDPSASLHLAAATWQVASDNATTRSCSLYLPFFFFQSNKHIQSGASVRLHGAQPNAALALCFSPPFARGDQTASYTGGFYIGCGGCL
jgi:hypothetical protein